MGGREGELGEEGFFFPITKSKTMALHPAPSVFLIIVLFSMAVSGYQGRAKESTDSRGDSPSLRELFSDFVKKLLIPCPRRQGYCSPHFPVYPACGL